MRILYCDFGTYCDFAISKEIILKCLKNNIAVMYITSNDNHQIYGISHSLLQVVTYTSPPVKQVVVFADNKNIIYSLLDIRKTFSTIRVLRHQTHTYDFIFNTIIKHWHSVDVLFFTYPLMCVVRQILTSSLLPPKLPVIVLYVAPAYPNLYIPWIFDNQIIDMETDIVSNKNKKENVRSHVWNDITFSLCGEKREFINLFWGYAKNKKHLMKRFRNLYVISSWNKDLIPEFVAPLNVPRSHWFSTNGIFERPTSRRPKRLPEAVANFLKMKGKLIYLTLGSMETTKLKDFVRVIHKAIKDQDMKLLVHDNQKILRPRSTKNLLVFTGFLSYASILPYTSLLLTTGSYCIQHLALSHHVPMLFVPILTEQYFWAKNYQQQTDISYIKDMSYSKENVQNMTEMIPFILNSKKLNKWLDQQSRSIQNSNGALEVVNLLKKQFT